MIEQVTEKHHAVGRLGVDCRHAGEETAEKELAADAGKIRSERDELQKKLASVSDEIDSAKKEAADASDRLVRLQADWDNYRKRTAAERLAERGRATEKLVGNLLPVIDDMKADWQNEKGAIDRVQDLKAKIEESKVEMERVTREGDLARASELRYSTIPNLQNQYDEAENALTARQKEGGLLKEEVTSEEIAEVVSACIARRRERRRRVWR